ncbi:S41 family peptidase [soil metagenome]
MSRANLAWLLIVPALLLGGLLFTYSAPPPEQDYQLVRTVVDVLAEVDKNYYRNLTPAEKKKFVEDMINGGLHTLDPHSQYFNEDALTKFEHDSIGEFGGIGITVLIESTEPYLVIQSPMPGTPAYDAGLAPGDVIMAIDGKDMKGIAYEDARKFIIGEAGTKVTFSIRRGDQDAKPFDVTMTRAKIEQHAVKGYVRQVSDPTQWNYIADAASGIAVIRLEQFNEKATTELRTALEAAAKEGMKALILDLRGNGGGLLTQAHEISDLFLKEGGIVSTKNRDEKVRVLKAKDDKNKWENPETLPMAVLVDHGSASASEIVAAALQENGRAIIIGERSYGKGSVQKVYHLPPDEKRAVKLTSEIWLTPSGKHIHREPTSKESDQWGVIPTPGYEVKLSLDDLKRRAQLIRKLDVVAGKPGVAPPPKPVDEKNPLPTGYQDPMIAKAIEYLKTKVK